MVDYASNSNKARARISDNSKERNREKIEPVIDGGATIKKKTCIMRVVDAFNHEDSEDIKSFIIDNLLNAIRKGGFNLLINCIEFIFNERYQSGRFYDGKENYRKYYDDKNRNYYRAYKPDHRDIGFDFDNLYFTSYGSAYRVLDELRYRLHNDKRDYITILEFYEASNVDTDNYTYDDFGWSTEDLRYADVKRSGNDYYISFPKAKSIRDLERR